MELGWYEEDGDYEKYKLTRDLRDIVKGKVVWRVESKFREIPTAPDEKPYAEIFVIDALTGQHLATEFSFIDWD